MFCRNVTVTMLNQFSLVFDGGSAGSVHYLGSFAKFSSANKIEYETQLLRFVPSGDEANLDVEEHIIYMM